MAKNPSSIWYWNDWLVDPCVRGCSMAAQGMWMQMLGIAAAADGYVRVGDKPCSMSDLATITGQDKRSVSRWVRELEKRGVFSRDEDGTIFCRRMRREAEARAAKRANGGAQVRKKSARSAHPSEGAKQPELFDNPPPKPEKCATPDSDSYAVSQDSASISKPLPESLDAPRAREGRSENNEKGNPEGGRCAPLADASAVHQPDKPAIRRTPVGMIRPAFWECNDELPSSLASATDYRDFALKCKCRSGGPAGTCDRSFDGQASEVPVHHYPILASTGGRDNALNGEGQPATVGLPRRGGGPPGKSPALKANIRGQLASKHWRYLMARGRPGEAEQYLILIDSKTSTPPQAMFDAVDHRMRAEGWDDMRDWKRQHGIACTRGGSVEHEAKTETLKDLLKRRGGWDRVEGAMQ